MSRTQVKNPATGDYVKRNEDPKSKQDGEFMAVKKGRRSHSREWPRNRTNAGRRSNRVRAAHYSPLRTWLPLTLACTPASMKSRFIRAMNDALISFGHTAEQL